MKATRCPQTTGTDRPRPPEPKTSTLRLARENVRDLLTRSSAFRAMPPGKQQQIAHDTVQVAAYLAEPEGVRVPGSNPAVHRNQPSARPLDDPAFDQAKQRQDDFAQVDKISNSTFKAGAAREGAAVAGALLKAVDFPRFVSGLIKGVFHAIVESSIEQMEAYGRLVADVAKTLNSFRDENVSPNQGRDQLINQFPDVFELAVSPDESGRPQPRVQVRDGVDEDAALKRINAGLPIDGGPVSDLDDETIEEKLVLAARTQMATSRQQLLATMVLMGINRIVVTDGKISAKVLYDFQARDNRRFARSAAAYDYAKDAQGNLQTTLSGEGKSEYQSEGGERTYSRDKDGYQRDDRDGSYYAKGEYKFSEQPVLTAMSTASEQSDSALSTKASLAGIVEVNFKSDYLPLEKMADPAAIAQIQMNAQPGMLKSISESRKAAAGAGSGSGTSPATASPTAPAATPKG